jgi:hypothetical protein
MTVRLKAFMSFVVVLQMAWLASIACAQETVSNYAKTQLNAIQNRNSADNFTIARTNNQVLRQGIPPVGIAGVNRQSFVGGAAGSLVGNSGMAGSKPFSRIDRGPTVSPYLALNNPLSTAEDYYNIVRPLQEQRRTNDSLSRQQYLQSRKLNQLAAQGPYQITGSERYAPTGHGSGFMRLGAYMNTGNYFAPPTQPKGSR